MSNDAGFSRLAHDLAEAAKVTIPHLEKEIFELQTELTQKEAQREAAGRAIERAANYPLTRGIDRICPSCWVLDGVESTLRCVPSSTSDDLYMCNTCNRDVVIASWR